MNTISEMNRTSGTSACAARTLAGKGGGGGGGNKGGGGGPRPAPPQPNWPAKVPYRKSGGDRTNNPAAPKR